MRRHQQHRRPQETDKKLCHCTHPHHVLLLARFLDIGLVTLQSHSSSKTTGQNVNSRSPFLLRGRAGGTPWRPDLVQWACPVKTVAVPISFLQVGELSPPLLLWCSDLSHADRPSSVFPGIGGSHSEPALQRHHLGSMSLYLQASVRVVE